MNGEGIHLLCVAPNGSLEVWDYSNDPWEGPCWYKEYALERWKVRKNNPLDCGREILDAWVE